MLLCSWVHRFVPLLSPFWVILRKPWSLTEITQDFPDCLPAWSTSEGRCAKITSVSAVAHREQGGICCGSSPQLEMSCSFCRLPAYLGESIQPHYLKSHCIMEKYKGSEERLKTVSLKWEMSSKEECYLRLENSSVRFKKKFNGCINKCCHYKVTFQVLERCLCCLMEHCGSPLSVMLIHYHDCLVILELSWLIRVRGASHQCFFYLILWGLTDTHLWWACRRNQRLACECLDVAL